MPSGIVPEPYVNAILPSLPPQVVGLVAVPAERVGFAKIVTLAIAVAGLAHTSAEGTSLTLYTSPATALLTGKVVPVPTDALFFVQVNCGLLPPFVAVAVSVTLEPAHIAVGLMDTEGVVVEFTVTKGVVLIQPVPICVKLKITVPFETPVTTPALVTVAMASELLVHVPPVVGNKVVVEPIQMVVAPVIETVGGTGV